MRVTFQKFFAWVWLAILLPLASGYWMLFTTFGGFAGARLYIRLMQMIGWPMIALFVWLFHGPWLAFERAVDVEDWSSDLLEAPPRCRGTAALSRTEIHVIQSRLLGPVSFLAAYADGLEKFGYRESPLEMMAYDAAASFSQSPEIL